jgi:hypothetical protein
MNLTKDQFNEIVKFAVELGFISKEGNKVDETKIIKLISRIDELKEFFSEWRRLCDTNPIRQKKPAVHKIHGTVLVLNTYIGVVNDELTNSTVQVITTEGKTIMVPHDEVMPYNLSTEVLFGDKK